MACRFDPGEKTAARKPCQSSSFRPAFNQLTLIFAHTIANGLKYQHHANATILILEAIVEIKRSGGRSHCGCGLTRAGEH
jgi:hypothetical protein